MNVSLKMSALISTVACMLGEDSYMSLRLLFLAPWPPKRPTARFVLRFASRKSFDRHSCTLGVISGTRSLSSPWLTLLRYSYNPFASGISLRFFGPQSNNRRELLIRWETFDSVLCGIWLDNPS